jgi:hypothetical protein
LGGGINVGVFLLIIIGGTIGTRGTVVGVIVIILAGGGGGALQAVSVMSR